jgi:hypothetical protein
VYTTPLWETHADRPGPGDGPRTTAASPVPEMWRRGAVPVAVAAAAATTGWNCAPCRNIVRRVSMLWKATGCCCYCCVMERPRCIEKQLFRKTGDMW